jgi:hypothetical protein
MKTETTRRTHLSVAAEAACVAAGWPHHAWSEGKVGEAHQFTGQVGAQIPVHKRISSGSSSSARYTGRQVGEKHELTGEVGAQIPTQRTHTAAAAATH